MGELCYMESSNTEGTQRTRRIRGRYPEIQGRQYEAYCALMKNVQGEVQSVIFISEIDSLILSSPSPDWR